MQRGYRVLHVPEIATILM
jgi:hypothetical protein